MEVRTAAFVRDAGVGVPADIEFVVLIVRCDGWCLPTFVPTLAGVVELLAEMTPPTVRLRCARGENYETLWAMIAPRERDTALH